jgi:hypothetical protein
LKCPPDERKPVETGSDPGAFQYASAYFALQTPVSTGGDARLTKFAIALFFAPTAVEPKVGFGYNA